MRISSSEWTGLASLNQTRLRERSMSEVVQRISSGLRINKGADDPSGLGISTGMRAVIRGLSTALQNAEDGLSMIRAADSHLNEIQDSLLRGRDLAVRAFNFAANNDADLDRLQSEVDAIVDSIDARAEAATFNGKQLLTGGAGREFEFTTRADWEAGTQYSPAGPDRLDTLTTDGDLKLGVRPWTDAVNSTKWLAQGNLNVRCVNLRTTAFTDNGDGTANVQVRLRTERAGVASAYTGFLQLDAGVNITALQVLGGGITNAVNSGGGRIDFTLDSSTAPTDRLRIAFTVDMTAAAQAWSCTLTGPATGTSTRFFFGRDAITPGGADQLQNKIAPYTVSGYFSEMYDTVTWRSAAIDTGGTTGGKATIAYNATTPAGTGAAVRLYQSADALTWTALDTSGGGSVDYTQRYLMAEALLTSNGIAFGAPELHDISVKLLENSVLQIGENSEDENKLYLSPVDARSSSIGLQGVDVRSYNQIVQNIDSGAEWSAAVVPSASTNYDVLGYSGDMRIASPISSSPNPIAQANGRNMYFRIDNSTLNADGTYTVLMTMAIRGQVLPGTTCMGWLGQIDVLNGDGTRVQFSSVKNVGVDTPMWFYPAPNPHLPTRPAPYTAGTGIPGRDPGPPARNISRVADAVYVDDAAIAGAGPDRWVYDAAFAGPYGANPNTLRADNGVITGTFDTIYFDYGSTGAADSVQFEFTAKPDAVISAQVEGRRNRNGTAANTNRDSGPANDALHDNFDIYFQNQLVADDVGAGVGFFNFERRLQEYANSAATGWVPPNPPTAQFETNAYYFGGGMDGSLESTGWTNNPGDAVQFEVYQSATGSGGWTRILDQGAGMDFTVDQGQDFVKVVGYMQGTAAVWATGPGGAYTYTESTAPVISDLTITKAISSIDQFDNAISRVSDMRAQLGVQERRLLSIINTLHDQRINITAARSRIEDADMAVEIAELAREQILANAATAINAQSDIILSSVLDLTYAAGIGDDRVEPYSGKSR